MKLQVEWIRSIPLKDATEPNSIYGVDFDRLPTDPGVYVFGRLWGNQFEALYVGKASRIRGRVKRQLNNLRLMQHIKNAKPASE
jgi:excinuclease UvrABC nuclease subunit